MKHLEAAMIVHEEEVFLGYPEHIHRVRGHLNEAARESLEEYPDLAAAIREHRIETLDDPMYMPPYSELLAYVDLLVECENQEMPAPELPVELRKPPLKSEESDPK
jgi:hypothetical protein